MTTPRSKTVRRPRRDWDTEAAKIKERLEGAWREGEYAVESMWHQSAIATLHWVAGHRSRVAGFRQAVKGTPIEKGLDAALKALRAEARTRAPAAPKKKALAARKKAAPRRRSTAGAARSTARARRAR